VEVERIEAHIRAVNPRCTVIRVSASTGEGLEAWHSWVRQQLAQQLAQQIAQLTPAMVLA
jgi:hydrogenase nickel incorporation protein HypB